MKVLFVASECAPFIKTGGLADVIGAVPKALVMRSISARVMIPLYPALAALEEGATEVSNWDDLMGGPARLLATQAEGIDIFLLDAPHLFAREGNIYLDADGKDWPDNAFRFGGLSRAAADVAVEGVGSWHPDIVHADDWQAGLFPAY